MSAGEYYDLSGKRIALGRSLGKGGEGEVFTLNGRPGVVAKLYKKPVDKEHAAKLHEMVHRQDAQLLQFTAWPINLVFTSPGKKQVQGFLMPELKGYHKFSFAYIPQKRLTYLPRANWRFIVHAARNTVTAFAALHHHDCVVGDVNEENILIADDATVKLIDCDSFQVKAGSRQFLCPVARPLFIPPELQGRSLRSLPRSENHDLFGMAVLCFYILFLGYHPFKGRLKGAAELPIAEAIERCLFPYGKAAPQRGLSYPRHGLPFLRYASSAVADLFEIAFGEFGRDFGRPPTGDWLVALDAFKKQLTGCRHQPEHIHYSAAECPWCKLEQRGMPSLFLPQSRPQHGRVTRRRSAPAVQKSRPQNLQGAIQAEIQGIQQVWERIFRMPAPGSSQLVKPSFRPMNPQPLPAHVQPRLSRLKAMLLCGIEGLVIMLIGIYIRQSWGLLASLGVFVVLVPVLMFTLRQAEVRGLETEKNRRYAYYQQCLASLNNTIDEWNQGADDILFHQQYQRLERIYNDCINSYNHLVQRSGSVSVTKAVIQQELGKLQKNHRALINGESQLQSTRWHVLQERQRILQEYQGKTLALRQAELDYDFITQPGAVQSTWW